MPFTHGLVLLLVDDDPRMRELTEAAAQRTGFFREIRTANDGTSGLESLAVEIPAPDLVLTDLSMPVMNGLEFVRVLRGNPAWNGIPVFMFSSSDHPNDRELALAAGCAAFFEKPASLAGIQAILGEVATAVTDHRCAG